MPKIEQGRAAHAYESAKKGDDKYKSFAEKLPMYIKTNGLAAALAFTKEKCAPIYGDIKRWLKKDDKDLVEWQHDNQDLIDALVNMESTPYRAVTVEVMAYLAWLRRFVKGKEDKKTDQEENSETTRS